MPPRHHHHGGGHHRPRARTRIYDASPAYAEPMCRRTLADGQVIWEFCPEPIPSDAMGIFGSLAAQKTAVSAEDGNWTALFAAMIAALSAGKVNSAYTNAFTDKHAAWKIFRDSILAGNELDESDFASQLDGWKNERAQWAQDLNSKTGVPLPPVISQAPPAKQENPDSLSSILSKSTGLVVAGAVLAAIVVFGGSRHDYYR